MTKNELINMLKIEMICSIRNRDNTDWNLYSEHYGYYNGEYKTYEKVIELLNQFDIYTTNTDDARNYVG